MSPGRVGRALRNSACLAEGRELPFSRELGTVGAVRAEEKDVLRAPELLAWCQSELETQVLPSQEHCVSNHGRKLMSWKNMVCEQMLLSD